MHHTFMHAHTPTQNLLFGRNVHLWHFQWPKRPWPKCPGRNVLGRNVRGRNVLHSRETHSIQLQHNLRAISGNSNAHHSCVEKQETFPGFRLSDLFTISDQYSFQIYTLMSDFLDRYKVATGFVCEGS